MAEVRIVDVTDEASFRLVPPCADPGFDHRSCDYWEDVQRGSKAARLSWLEPGPEPSPAAGTGSAQPVRGARRRADRQPVRAATGRYARVQSVRGRWRSPGGQPVRPAPPTRPTFGPDVPRKLGLLGRGIGVFGSYAKVLLLDEVAAVYAQFGPLSAYPRALRLRELYPQLPDAPLPAVITCIATTREARGGGHARRLVEAVCDDLAERGFAAVEAYPEAGARPDATSGATPAFWQTAGFSLAVDDERFPVVRRELA